MAVLCPVCGVGVFDYTGRIVRRLCSRCLSGGGGVKHNGVAVEDAGSTWAAPSGARSSEEKPRYDLIPLCASRREAVRMAAGARSHGENNYQNGAGDPVFARDRINHLIEHALKYAAGDRSDDHLAAIRCNAGMLIWLDENRKA